ncbi:conserved hypothetical protein [Vibrio jasicida]|uniref:DUF4381 domain-containing protein n=1 Tax=Vibrio jasicida TaxID=766224 RepID=A0AAU9QN96_9VIBR|nr:conserved hypothetical protein [Vibrio jasicida]CAH1588025.1 conserved hypothetical protein [Vibrio jasicida]
MGNSTQGQIVEFGSHLVKRAEWIDPPAAISWLPQTLAWQLIGLALFSASILFWGHRYHQYLKRSYLRQAWALFQHYHANNQLAAIADLIKRLANQHWPNESVGLMDSQHFADFIANNSHGRLTADQIMDLMSTSYQPSPTLDPATQKAIYQWFKELTC